MSFPAHERSAGSAGEHTSICTLHSIAANQEAIQALFGVRLDSPGNLPSMLAVFPDWKVRDPQSSERARISSRYDVVIEPEGAPRDQDLR
jgi:hypothetical protein